MLKVAAILIALLALAHSFLGERYILIRLFRGRLPELFGGTDFIRNTLRFAWHLTTVLALGVSVLMLKLDGAATPRDLVQTLGWTFIASGFLPLFFTRGRHLSWIVLFAAGGMCLAWSGHN